MTPTDTAKVESWVIQRWNDHPDIAAIFQHLHDTHATGRLMLHLGNGTPVAVEFCERASDDLYIPEAT